MSEFTHLVINKQGIIEPRVIAKALHTTVSDIAFMVGVSPHTLSKKDRASSTKPQAALNNMVIILNRATPWCGSIFQAYAWYRSEPIPSCDNRTAEALVKDGHADLVLDYIDHIEQGGFA